MDNKEVRNKIRKKEICLAGNRKLKIYGLLSCRSGKRMNKINRVFFVSEQEAISMGYRPCAHCLPDRFHEWKVNQ
jgi:methylphosphotriester-DNA--protein-cysteine methyltransferase